MSLRIPEPFARFTVDSPRVLVFEARAQVGRAGAAGVARAIAERQAASGRENVVFAAAPSQNEFLAGLIVLPGIDWSQVVAFHLEEYLGLDSDHPASFRRYLQEHHAVCKLFRTPVFPGSDDVHPMGCGRDVCW